MGRFSRQLARLPSPPASVPPIDAAPERAPCDVGGGGEPARLATLRDQLAKALHKTASGVAPRRAGAMRFEDAMPFSCVDTPAGPLWRRRVRHEDDDHVGRVRLAAVRRVDVEALSALSLTPELARLDPMRALGIDTETTGLGGGTGNYAFLVGLTYREHACWIMEQIMLAEPDDEPAMLAYVRQRIAAAHMLVSYNGKSFDMPLLRARYVMCRQPAPPERPHLDLLHVARRVHAARAFRKTLTSLEREVLGFDRGPDVAGEEVAARYLQYVRFGDARLLDGLYQHNAHDVVSLVALLAIYGQPLERLDADELAAAARAVMRSGDLDRALGLADAAISRDAGDARLEGLRVRAAIHKIRGDATRAVDDYEAVCRQADDPDARLALAKLYEHRLALPGRALALTERGTGEGYEGEDRRKRRLIRKIRRDLPAVSADGVLASPRRLG